MSTLRFIIASVLMVSALLVLSTGVLGVWRFKYCLNRLHAAAVNDTLGLLLAIASLVTARGLSLTSLKMVLIVVILWMFSPASSHLLAQLEVRTAEDLKDHLHVVDTTDRPDHGEV